MSAEWSDKQCRIATADALERSVKAYRDGSADGRTQHAVDLAPIITGQIAKERYVYVLELLNVGRTDIDAAVAAISEGKHPPDSLPAFVEKMALECQREGSDVFDWDVTLERIGAQR